MLGQFYQGVYWGLLLNNLTFCVVIQNNGLHIFYIYLLGCSPKLTGCTPTPHPLSFYHKEASTALLCSRLLDLSVHVVHAKVTAVSTKS